MSTSSLWDRFQEYFPRYNDIGISIDISRMRSKDDFIQKMQPRVATALKKIAGLEGSKGTPKSAAELAGMVEAGPEDVYHVLTQMLANTTKLTCMAASGPGSEKFSLN